MTTQVTGSFTGTGTSSTVTIESGDVMLSGTFVGTVELQVNNGTSWFTADTYTAPTVLAIEPGYGPRDFRLECTAYTSGTINYSLGW